MSQTVGDFLIERLHAWGVREVSGYPGDGINGVFGALQRAESRIEFIQVRHEEMAAFMAAAYARFSGALGVCIAISGPGASHLLTGLYDARMDHGPVLAIVGQQARTAMGAHDQQELDLNATFKDVAGAFVRTVLAPARMRHLVDRAVRTAVSERAVTALIVPNDLQDLPYEAPKRVHGFTFSGVGYAQPKVVPYDRDLREAAAILNEGDRVAMLIGAGRAKAPHSDRPVVLEVRTDPEVPPLPPHITFEQATTFMSMLVKGDQREKNVILGAARQVIGSLPPGHADG